MEQEENFFKESRNRIEKYIQDRVLLFKMETVEKSSNVIAVLCASLAIAILSFFIVLFLSIMAAYFFAEITNSIYIGFGIVSAFYLIVLIVIIVKRKIVEKKIRNVIVKIFFDKPDYDGKN